MIVVHFINDDGGVGNVVVNLCEEQLKHGYKVVAVVSHGEKNFLKRLDSRVMQINIPKKKLPHMLIGLDLCRIYAQIKKKYPEEKIILHAHNAATVGLLANLKELPLICTIHGVSVFPSKHFSTREKVRNIALRLIFRKMQKNHVAIVGVSQNTSDYYSQMAGVRFTTIHNGTSMPMVGKQAHEGFVVAHLGDISINKGWNIELEAFCLLKNLLPDKKLQFISAGRAVDFNSRTIEKLRKEKRLDCSEIDYRGVVTDVYQEVLMYADVLVLISVSEGLPMSIVEAQSMGIPVIATAVGGINEIIKDGENGFLICRSISELAQKLQVLAINHTQYNEMASKSMETYQNEYTAEKMAMRYNAIYKTLGKM